MINEVKFQRIVVGSICVFWLCLSCPGLQVVKNTFSVSTFDKEVTKAINI